MQFDRVGSQFFRRLDLIGRGFDEKAHADAGSLQSAHRRLERLELARRIETALGRDFAAVLRHEARVIGQDFQRELHDLRRVAEFKVQLRDHAVAQPHEVAILDVPPVGAQMHGDPAGPGTLADGCRRDDIRLAVGRVGRPRVARLPQGGDVVDVDAENHGNLVID